MKKIIILGVALLILVTGCASGEEKKLVCTRTANMNGLEMDFRYEVYYQGEDVNKVKTTEKVTSDSESTLKTIESQTKALYSNFDNIENYNYKVTLNGNTLTSTTDIDYTKIDIDELLKIDSSIEQLLNDSKKIALDKITQIYESAGAVCKEE